MPTTNLRCTNCRAIYQTSEKVLVCTKCSKLLNVEYDLEDIERHFSKGSLTGGIHSLWRYRELLPIGRDDCIVSLGEGMTPMVKGSRYGSVMGIDDLAFKLDFLNPTGSFKDRGTTVSVSKLKELQISLAMDDSSGNAASSLAAYCACAGIQCELYVPASIPAEKLVQTQIYGAKIRKITGSRTDVAMTAEEYWKRSGVYYASHNLSPYFFEGMKTLAFEICESLNWSVPDHIVFPVGGGALIAGACKGFKELVELHMIDEMPRLHCVQSEACAPIVDAFSKGKVQVDAVSEGETIAGGIRISNPARGWQVLQALRETKGSAVSVTDEEIRRHQRLLAKKEGIFAEPTSCAPLAGLEKLRDTGLIDKSESVIIPLTGFGLKDTKSATFTLDS